jgi:hypothetical protein
MSLGHQSRSHPTLDDAFFSIDAFNRETEELEALDVTSGALGADESASEADDDDDAAGLEMPAADGMDDDDDEGDDEDDFEKLMSAGPPAPGGDIWAQAVDAGDGLGTDGTSSHCFAVTAIWTRRTRSGRRLQPVSVNSAAPPATSGGFRDSSQESTPDWTFSIPALVGPLCAPEGESLPSDTARRFIRSADTDLTNPFQIPPPHAFQRGQIRRLLRPALQAPVRRSQASPGQGA